MDHHQFVALVAQMREAQRGFFRAKKQGKKTEAVDYLRSSLHLEEKVDQEIANIQSGQQSLNLG